MSSNRRKERRSAVAVHHLALEISQEDNPLLMIPVVVPCRFRNGSTCELHGYKDSRNWTWLEGLCPNLQISEQLCLSDKVSVLCNYRCHECDLSISVLFGNYYKPNPKYCNRKPLISYLKSLMKTSQN